MGALMNDHWANNDIPSDTWTRTPKGQKAFIEIIRN